MPVPENQTIDNPTLNEMDRDIRIRVLKSFGHAYGGVNVVRYLKDEIVEVSAVCADRAIKDGDATRCDDELYDPRHPSVTRPAGKAFGAAPENKMRK